MISLFFSFEIYNNYNLYVRKKFHKIHHRLAILCLVHGNTFG